MEYGQAVGRQRQRAGFDWGGEEDVGGGGPYVCVCVCVLFSYEIVVVDFVFIEDVFEVVCDMGWASKNLTAEVRGDGGERYDCTSHRLLVPGLWKRDSDGAKCIRNRLNCESGD